MLVLMFRARAHDLRPRRSSGPLGVSFLALTSQYVPPNPRMLITAFPALMVVAYYVKGKWFTWLAWANGIAAGRVELAHVLRGHAAAVTRSP